MEYTVQQLAELAGVSARTLRYYDNIGLLCPARGQASGYRKYGTAEVDRLQQILFYRALGFELAEISRLLTAPDYDRLCALRAHKTALTERLRQTQTLLRNLNNTIQTLEGDKTMSDKEKFEGFKANLVQKNEQAYGDELRQKYGKETIKESNKKMMNLTQQEYDRFEQVGNEILEKLADAVKAKKDPAGEEGREVAQLHKEWLSFTWPKYTKEAHRGLVQMYLLDERFTAFYEKAAPGAAQFLHDAVCAFLA
ncbi:MAG: MerR family transcriptional regulator [Pygmaiobacter massiliensis]